MTGDKKMLTTKNDTIHETSFTVEGISCEVTWVMIRKMNW